MCTIETFAKHCTYVFFAAKARARGRAALRRYPLIGDRPGYVRAVAIREVVVLVGHPEVNV